MSKGKAYRVRVTIWVSDPEELTIASLQLSKGGKRHAIITHTKEAKYAIYRPVWRGCPERWIDPKVVFPGRIFYEF